jgi:transposase
VTYTCAIFSENTDFTEKAHQVDRFCYLGGIYQWNHKIECLLNLPGVTVIGRSHLEGFICLHLEILTQEMDCLHCRKSTSELHQVRPILVRDLPIFGQPVYLRVPRRQFYCRHCQRYVTEKLEFLPWRRRYTQRYECQIYQRVLLSDIEQVSREEDLTYDEVEGIFKSVSSSAQKKTWGEVKRLSIDEVSKRKGHRDFVTVVSDIDQGSLIEVIDSHKQQEIINTLKQQWKDCCNNPRAFTRDMQLLY